MVTTQKEYRELVGDLVDRILERGRLSQLEQEGKIGVKDGGISMRRTAFINEIIDLAKPEPVMHRQDETIIMRKPDGIQ